MQASMGIELKLCQCCGSPIRKHAGNLQYTLALTTAALLLYIPANVFPILRMNMYGAMSENTVWQGVVRLHEDGDTTIAIVVFLASILIPLLKLLCLFFLSISTSLSWQRWKLARSWIYRILDWIGRWAMLDVFVLAILVSLVKLQNLASVVAGPGAIAFAGVVVLTMLAAQSFDPALIWAKDGGALE